MRPIPLMMLAMVLLSACATPKPALDEANHGVALIAELEKSLAEFRRIETNSLNARAESIRDKKNAIALVEKTLARDMRTRAAAGDQASVKLYSSLIDSADAIAKEDAEYQAAIARNDATIAALLTPLPSTKEATSTAQAALADLGKELTPDERRAELIDYFKYVKASVQEARKKIDEAEAAASAAESKTGKDG